MFNVSINLEGAPTWLLVLVVVGALVVELVTHHEPMPQPPAAQHGRRGPR